MKYKFKKIFFLAVPFFILPCYGEENIPLANNQQENVMSQNELTQQEKIEVKNAIVGAIKVINDNNAMDEQVKFFGKDTLYAPKSPKAPILERVFEKGELITLDFIKNKDGLWNKVVIFFPSYKRLTIKTEFDEKYFTQEMGLTFDKLSEHTIQHSASDGMEAYETKEYTFDYHWTLNSKIKVSFNVRPEDVLKNEKFPSNFTIVTINRES